MSMSFRTLYAMSFNPFERGAQVGPFPSADLGAMTNRLNYLADVKGIGVFTSLPGMGKSYALRHFASTLDKNTHTAVYVNFSTVSVHDFYVMLCDMLDVATSVNRSRMFSGIRERIHTLYKEERRPLFLMIDEAHELSTTVLRDLKLMSNFELDALNCFSLALVGESTLASMLSRPSMEALRQRVTVHCRFHGMDDAEARAYIDHKLKAANSSCAILEEAAIFAIVSSSKGVPRVIDRLMVDVIALGCQMEKQVIDAEVVREAVDNMAI